MTARSLEGKLLLGTSLNKEVIRGTGVLEGADKGERKVKGGQAQPRVRVRIKLGVLFEDAGYIPLVTYSYKRVIMIQTLEKTKQRL